MTDGTTEEPTLDTDPVEDAEADAASDAASDTQPALDREAGEPPRRRRGSLVVYAVAFALMLVAIASLVVGALGIASYIVVAETSFFGTQRILRVSAVFSGLAIVTAIVALFVPRRSR